MKQEVCSVVLQRWGAIESLRDTPKDKRTLVEELDCSRSTVNRAIRELESMGLVEYVGGEYAITPLGDTIADGFAEMMETVDLRSRLEPFLQWMPDDEFDLDLKHLRDVKLVVPEPGDPYAMINRHVSKLEELESGQFLLPYVGVHATEKANEQIVKHGAEVEIVVGTDVWNTLQKEPNYSSAMEEMVDTGRVSVFRYDDEMSFSLAIFDDAVQIIADEDEEPRALIETANRDVRTWAEATFKEYKQHAESIVQAREATTEEPTLSS